MRHVIGVIVGLVLAPVSLVATGWSTQLGLAVIAHRTQDTILLLLGVGVLALVGVAFGLAASTRWLSPVVSLICGVVWVAGAALILFAHSLVAPFLVGGDGPDGMVFSWVELGLRQPFLLLVVGALLVVASLTPRRWRKERRQGALPPMSPDEPPNPSAGLMGPAGQHAAPAGQPTAQYTMPQQAEPPNTGYGPAGPPRY